MIRVNTEQIYELIDRYTSIVSDVEDVLARTKSLCSEMQGDMQFMALPESITILNLMDTGIARLNQIYDDVVSVKTALEMTPDRFIGNENEIKRSIEELIARLSAVEAQLNGAMTSNQVMNPEENEETRINDAIEKEVMEASTDLKVCNIAALTRIAEEENPVDEVVTFDENGE